MTKILIEIDTDTQRVVQIATQEDRSYPEDEKHENGNYFNTCYHCGRTFVGHKRRAVCKVCAAAPQPEPVDVDLRRKYEELLMMVARKFPNESRHETALRYIRQMEEPKTTAAKLAMAQGE